MNQKDKDQKIEDLTKYWEKNNFFTFMEFISDIIFKQLVINKQIKLPVKIPITCQNLLFEEPSKLRKIQVTIHTIELKENDSSSFIFSGWTREVHKETNIAIDGEFCINTRNPSGGFKISNKEHFRTFLGTLIDTGVLD